MASWRQAMIIILYNDDNKITKKNSNNSNTFMMVKVRHWHLLIQNFVNLAEYNAKYSVKLVCAIGDMWKSCSFITFRAVLFDELQEPYYVFAMRKICNLNLYRNCLACIRALGNSCPPVRYWCFLICAFRSSKYHIYHKIHDVVLLCYTLGTSTF